MSGTTSFSPAGRGGSLLPSGYLSTSGSQIVDDGGNVVRVNSIGWNQGFYDIPATVSAMKADGFNTIRISWVNATMQSDLQQIDQIVGAAKSVGMKVILDNHTNESGTPADGYGSQQSNGLWYDQGGASNGTNGAGVAGTVTDQQFLADWTTVAQRYAGNDTVVGFDVRNEPLAYGGMSTWGDGSNTDIHAMYERVGNAIQAVDPGKLVIAEGPQNYNGSFDGSTTAPEGDLTGVRTTPVVLNTPNKVVYSVHEYPGEISGLSVDSGQAYVDRMNHDWGYLVSGNIAPVWIGEMGSSMNTSDGQAWADTITSYVNGGQAGNGGPSTPISTDWWAWGNLEGQAPNGTLQSDGTPRPEQQAITDRLLFIPTGTIAQPPVTQPPVVQPPAVPLPGAVTPSNDQTQVMAGSSGVITDAAGNAWSITDGGQVAVNGAADSSTGGVTELAYVGGNVWQQNNAQLWWAKSSPDGSWGPAEGTATSPLSGSAPPDAAIPPPFFAEPVSSPEAQVTIPSDQATVTVDQIGAVVTASGGDHTVFITGAGNTLSLSGGLETVSDEGGSNTFSLPAAGTGYTIFTTDILGAGDTLDLRVVLQAAGWDGQADTVPNFVNVADTAEGTSLFALQNGQADQGMGVAMLQGQHGLALSDVLGHALTT